MFAGSGLQTDHARPAAQVVLPQPDVEDELNAAPTSYAQPASFAVAPEPAPADEPEQEPMVIDTTAELLGRAKAKPRARTVRTPASPPARAARSKTAAKPARRARSKKTSAGDEPA